MRNDHERPPNAFLEPNNPLAVFPQVKKPDIIDYRSHKMRLGGYAAVGMFRKIDNPNAKQSKYATIVKTTEMLEQEMLARELAEAEKMDVEVSETKKTEEKPSKPREITAKDIEEMQDMTMALSIGKKKKQP